MRKYELALILKPSLDDEAVKAASARIQDIITRYEGTIDKIDEWGKRRMAYEIKKIGEGIYSFITFSANVDVPAQIESRLRIDEDVLRYLIVSLER